MGNRILILGASGFLGNALYKELLPYFDVYGTYCSQQKAFGHNQVFYSYSAENDALTPLLEKVRPSVIISSLQGNFEALYAAHRELISYVSSTANCRILFLSSVRVFDGRNYFVAYETDKPLANTAYGKYKISVEKMLQELPLQKYAIMRLPMVLGINAPRLLQIKAAIKHKSKLEVYPNLVINVTTDSKVSQQIHYIINQNKYGVFHLGSTDLIHHSDLVEEIVEKLGTQKPVYSRVYETNEDRFLAVLPKTNLLPNTQQITVNQVINQITLDEKIRTIKEILL